jgi:hypothetical protein
MSDPTTGAAQRRRLVTLGVPPAELALLTDVDTWDDARSVAASVPGSAFAVEVGRVAARLEPAVLS